MESRYVLLLAAAWLGGTSLAAASDRLQGPPAPLDVEIYDRTRGAALPVHRHRGDLYVVGEPGHEYEIRLRNRESGRVLAVTSVDGVNVVSGETAAVGQSGYVVDGRGHASIDGWRKSLDDVASFHFTQLRDSYAARTGRPDHVGVIGVAMFRERTGAELASRSRAGQAASEASAAAPSAPASHADAERAGESRRLGTGHGERRDSPASWTRFERASRRPDAVLRIHYDSRERLVARGILADPRRYGARPDPFPGGFVPDP